MNERKSAPIFGWTPRPWQQTVLDGQKQNTIILASRRSGKTDLCAYIASTAFLSSQKPLNICVASFSLKNAKAVIWSRLLELLQPFPPHVTLNKTDLVLTNIQTGSTIRLFGLSAEHGDSIRGFSFNLAILDEFSQIPYDIFVSAFKPTLIDKNGWMVGITTPKGSFDLIHVLKAECSDSDNKESHVFFHFPASQLIGQVPNITKIFLEKERLRNPLTYSLEFEADITASAYDTVFDNSLLGISMTPVRPYTSSTLAVSAGLDFAPRRDKSILAVRNSRNFIVFEELYYNGDPHDFVQQVKRLVTKYSIRFLAVDKGGAGEVISDALESALFDCWPIEDVRGVISNERPSHPSNYNLRAELYAMLRDYLSRPSTTPTSIEGVQTFLNELSATTQKPNDSGRFQIIGKHKIIEKIGHSPDYADAASLSFYFQRYENEWKKPIEEMTSRDIGKMTNREILDTFPDYYEPQIEISFENGDY